MRQKQRILHSVASEVVFVLLASIVSFPLCDVIGAQLSVVPFLSVVSYVVFKLLYHLCMSLSAHIIDLTSFLRNRYKNGYALENISSTPDNNEVMMKRMELFHYEFQHEQQQYRQQKEKEEDDKLNAVLRYTRDTFKRLDFEEGEIFQICECVRYFVTNRQVLTNTSVHIKRRTAVTQIALKNFAWNIAFQYNISGDITAQFVMQTFAEWFANSTIDTIRKNLRTTTGRHKIEIDENILTNANS